MDTQYPLREKRKRASREALLKAAYDLFTEKGVDRTTLDEVARQAGLHVQTLYTHFRNKSELVAAVEQVAVDEFEALLRERKADTLSCWREWIEQHSTVMLSNPEYRESVLARMAPQGTETAFMSSSHEYERLLADGLADDLGIDPTESRLAMLIACMLVGANEYVFWQWVLSEGTSDVVSEAHQVVDEVESLVNKLRP